MNVSGHKFIRPKAIHDPDIVEEYAKHYMYFACIQFINSVKTASLRWHSPMLDDISAVRSSDLPPVKTLRQRSHTDEHPR